MRKPSPQGFIIVVKNMDKMGLASRIGHSHALRKWSIYPVSTTKAVPKVKEVKYVSGVT